MMVADINGLHAITAVKLLRYYLSSLITFDSQMECYIFINILNFFMSVILEWYLMTMIKTLFCMAR